MRLYSELATWYPILTPVEDYLDEAASYTNLLRPAASTLLELGCGGGANAWHMKPAFASCTLTDLSPDMLAISERLNPDCEHILGDMRTIRLNREFDAVFVHDAVDYMTTIADLRAAIETAYVHTRPGGVALFVPDAVTETFEPGTDDGGSDGPGGRSLRYLSWSLAPAPGSSTYEIHWAYMLNDNGQVSLEYDLHVCGIFPRQTWVDLFEQAGYIVEMPDLDPEIHEGQVAFLCRRPAGQGR